MSNHFRSGSLSHIAELDEVAGEIRSGESSWILDECLNRSFEVQAAKTPDAVALVFEESAITYDELNRKANRLAHYLRKLGVGPEVLVALCADPCPELIVSILAVLKAGGGYLPLDPAFPADRLAFMLEDAAPHVLLTQSHLRELLPGIDAGPRVVDIVADESAWMAERETNIDNGETGLSATNRAHIIYTSGSTGKPKGVELHHRALSVLAQWFIREFHLTPDFVSLPVTTFSFSAFYKNIYGPLFSGGRVHLLRNLKDTKALLAAASRYNVRFLNLTPTALSMLLDADTTGVVSRLETIMLVGEPIQLQKLSELPNSRPEIINTYGQAEAGLATVHRIAPDADLAAEMSTAIGHPFPYVRIHILDNDGKPVPDGVEGELYIASPTVARGYLNRPELTAERFLPDQFSPEPGARYYRTGDRGRRLPDGVIEFIGRKDLQVKIRGVRIEPGEIEVRLMEHPAIREAIVLVREDNPGDERLVAYYLPSQDSGVTPATPELLRAHMEAALPLYLVPVAYVALQCWPMTTTGKLDRRGLPQATRECYPSTGYEPPETTMEAEVASIWAGVLKTERVGRKDNFFLLGGNSLLAMQVEVRLRKAFAIELPVSLVFEHPTVETFAKEVEAALEGLQGDADLLRILDDVEAMSESNAEEAG